MIYLGYWGERAYWVNSRTKKTHKLFQRSGKEWPKFSCFGLGVSSNTTLKALALLKKGETYQNYKRVQ